MNLSGIKAFYSRIDFKYSLIVFAVLIFWSSSYIGIRFALESFSPGNLGFLRYLTASVIFFIASLFRKFKVPSIRDLPGLTALGLFGFALYNILLNYGETVVDAGSSSFIINTVPFFTLLFAVLTRTETASKKDWTGMAVAFAGVTIIIISKNQGIHAFNWHTLLILGAAVCQALYFMIQKKYLKKYTSFELTSFSIWIGTLLLWVSTNHPFTNIQVAPFSQTMAVVYLGVFPGAAAFFLMGLALNKYQLSQISSYLFLIPFITVFISWAVISEVISVYALTGGILIILGILIKNKFFKR
ncbi:DMT family transporter [Mucilaginibacter sp. X4EP1]|uniref:DMT family transporter n=1 Tax=Mucilaginibacter sp. X4EP1 TaxID=2723092 RepID=UPI00216A54A1|nr:EamA family transporter [Mucilaginibacter sp. X4EP1]MCS3811574.1 drug/metabolite transporter (DMT)-like permease [Mucilaginibacter sp. X4EP1]